MEGLAGYDDWKTTPPERQRATVRCTECGDTIPIEDADYFEWTVLDDEANDEGFCRGRCKTCETDANQDYTCSVCGRDVPAYGERWIVDGTVQCRTCYWEKEIQEPDWTDIGAVLAHANAGNQTAFLHSFLSELKRACGTHYRMEMQLLEIGKFLHSEERDYVRTIAYVENQS